MDFNNTKFRGGSIKEFYKVAKQMNYNANNFVVRDDMVYCENAFQDMDLIAHAQHLVSI